MKKPLFAFLAFFIANVSAITRLPEEFTVAERFLSFTSAFDIGTELEPFAHARKRFFSFTTTFDLEDMQGQMLASASSRFFAWGTVADVTDPSGIKIGWIEEEVFRILPWAEYKVFNFENRLVAIAKMNFWGTHFEVSHPDRPEEIYATITRPFFRCCRDHWTVQIKNYGAFEEGYIDPRLLVILAIFQTDKDNRDRYRAQVIDQIRQDQEFYQGRNL